MQWLRGAMVRGARPPATQHLQAGLGPACSAPLATIEIAASPEAALAPSSTAQAVRLCFSRLASFPTRLAPAQKHCVDRFVAWRKLIVTRRGTTATLPLPPLRPGALAGRTLPASLCVLCTRSAA